ncbi:hypothetical protein ACA910_016846 [Epithemia clementina (nom. ined.)]
MSFSASSSLKKLTVDHLVYVVPNLADAIKDFEHKTGVRPAVGGKHMTLGTHNAFLALGDGRYLELFAPDPQAECPLKTVIGVDGGRQPRLSTFCCDAGNVGIDDLVSKLSSSSASPSLPTSTEDKLSLFFPSSVEAGSRTNEKDNSVISWRAAVEKHMSPWYDLPMGGLLPFYIDWGESRDVRPATTAPTGCLLTKLVAHHPEPATLKQLYQHIGYGMDVLVEVQEGPEPRLVATLETPKGVIELS